MTFRTRLIELYIMTTFTKEHVKIGAEGSVPARVCVENNPFGLNKCVYFDVSLSSSLTPYTFNTPVKLNDRAKFYTNVRQEDRKNKTKHLRLSGLYNTDRMV